MKMKKFVMAVVAVMMMAVTPVMAAPEVGKPAPDFTAVDSNGKTVHLSDYKGKNVVLEWTNHECPFVVKHYGSSNMQKVQKEATKDGAVWLSIVSSASGEQGHITGAVANSLTTDRGAAPTAVLLDETGEIANLYAAKTTPHMFVVNKEGILSYAGAIDSIASARQGDIEKADNYVLAALHSLNAGHAPEVTSTRSYGCGIKFAR